MSESHELQNNLERSGGSGGERHISIHPLVMINISDHYTRASVDDVHQRRILGAIFGVQQGLQVTMYNSSEIKYHIGNDGVVTFDKDYLQARKEQFATIFPNFELLGWYSVGPKVLTGDIAIHRGITEFNESPLFLLLDPNVEQNAKSLPITIFESEIHVLNDVPTMLFVRTPFKVETLEAERIAVDHVAKFTPASDGSNSTLISHFEGIRNAVSILQQRIKMLYKFLQATRNGDIPMDHTLIRKIASICNQLPAIGSNDFRKDFLKEYNDTLLVTYLANITKGATAVADIIEKVQLCHDGRRVRGHII